MVFVYIVRCNFTDHAKESAWNTWYSGPKIAQMLTKPHFRSGQRFKRASGTGRDYLALWTVQSPDALTTPEYKADWGFSEWEPYIANWSRDLFDARPSPEDAFAVKADGALQVVSFDGMSVDDALAARTMMTPPPETLWLSAVGLDRHTPLIGLAPVSDAATGVAPENAPAPNVQQAIYRPICGFRRAAE
jgi:hypothetical protein